MILKSIRGCICDSLTVNGIEEINLTNKVRREVLNQIACFMETIDDDKANYILNEYLLTVTNEEEYECRNYFYDAIINEFNLPIYSQITDIKENEKQIILSKFKTLIKNYLLKLNTNKLNYILQDIIPLFGTYYSDGIQCQCCGDYVEEYTLEIK